MVLLLTTLFAPATFAQTPADEADQRLVTQMGKALTNDAASQYELAKMYEKGDGTPRDLRLAQLWYTKSAKQGYGPAVQRLAMWDADMEKLQREEKQRAEQEERARQQAEAARQAARERAALEAKAKQQAEAEARAAREAARARQQKETAAKAASPARQEAPKRKPVAAQAPEAPAAPPIAAKASSEPAPAPAAAPGPAAANTETKEEAEKAEFTANPCKGPSAKFMSTCK
jgi:hypothetical protein